MIRLYLLSMFSIALLDLFDRLCARYGYTTDVWSLIPDLPVIFGIMKNVSTPGILRDLRFLHVKIPFLKTWGVNFYTFEMSFRSHRLIWIESRGWRIFPPLE